MGYPNYSFLQKPADSFSLSSMSGMPTSPGAPTVASMQSWSNPLKASNYTLGETSSYNIGPGTQFTIDPELTDIAANGPAAQGGWFDMKGKGGMLLGGAQVALGAFNAFDQAKMNDFMKGYYGNQMALQKTDFANAAKSTNTAMSEREGRRLDATGIGYDTAANKAGRDNYMKDWGVQTTFA
jgi:hypothetical protein